MYRAPSPFNHEQQQRAQPYSGVVAPGQITYTTSTDSDGRILYHPFRAVAASYQTPAGVISGIQWVPAEATKILPPGAQPANSEFAAAWSRNPITKQEEKALKEWQRDEEKRRKKEEKEARRQREKEQNRAMDADSELRKARERDAQAAASRERRKSFNQGTSGVQFPPSVYPPSGGTAVYQSSAAGYPSTPYNGGYNGGPAAGGYEAQGQYSISPGMSELDRQMGSMDLGNREGGMARPARYQTDTERVRKLSSNLGGERAPYNMPGSYSAAYPAQTTGAYPSQATSAYPAQTTSAYPAQAANTYPAQATNSYPAAYGNPSPNISPHIPYATSASSYSNPQNYSAIGTSLTRPTTPYGGGGGGQVYPPGHVLEGQPIQQGAGVGGMQAAPGVAYSAGQAAFPVQMPDPNVDLGQLAAPEGFSRPVNTMQNFLPFEKMKVQDMDDLVQNAPRMPTALQPHDVYASDWNRLMQDLCLAWTGRLPAPGRSHKKSSLAIDLLDLWNVSFFLPRGVEVILYKGRERRSGPQAGVVDIHLSMYEHEDSDSSSSSSSSDPDSDDDGSYAYMYGQHTLGAGQGSMADVLERRRRRREARAEKKRRRKEKKARRKAKAREKKYALYLACVPNFSPGMAGAGGMAAMGGVPGMMSGMNAMGAPGMAANTPYGAIAGGMPMSNHSGGY